MRPLIVMAIVVLTLAVASAFKRLRREIRSLSPSEWNDVVNAIRVMKFIPQEEGRSIYGPDFRSYDDLIAQHATASLSVHGDQAHFSEVFPIFHRAWCLAMENSLLSINSNIQGLPYWDFSLDMDDSGVHPSIFSETYLGGSGDPIEGYAVVDGPFSYWPIADISSGIYGSISSPYGQLRHPLSINPSPYMTRRLGSLCGIKFDLGDSRYYKICSSLPANISEFRLCVDGTIHGPAHLAIGGSWRRDSQKDDEDSLSCSQWYGQIQPQVKDPRLLPPLGSFTSAFAAGCLECPKTKCLAGENPDSCVCTRKVNSPRSCGPLWTNLKDDAQYGATLAPCDQIQIIGDFVDAVCSPNDPIFAFHHSNIDRIFDLWLKEFDQYTLEELDYFQYPVSGLGYGSNLYDPLSPDFPFTDLVPGYPLDNTPYTVQDLLASTFGAQCPYKYEHTAATNLPIKSPGKKPTARSLLENESDPGSVDKNYDIGSIVFIVLVVVPATVYALLGILHVHNKEI